ncbi:hypothetical protein Micbo1qcDRAFT_237403 [Microdochium bolleyi]|uniref:ubiquitinyl hydrolase 1 n=1 Tax=Microdochium bolleyi TaxID=196109 RepID=A0A136IKW1_9PEZI|nr:hypothetical protein Micbo1qcDRAFT_237403 [Microdochium bolleyi]
METVVKDLPMHIWKFLEEQSIANDSADLCVDELSYDAKWFLPWKNATKSFIVRNWLKTASPSQLCDMKGAISPDKDIIELRRKKESFEAFHRRGRASWEQRAEKAVGELATYFGAQWPCAVPAAPTGTILEDFNKYFRSEGNVMANNEVFIEYGLALTRLQRAQRLSKARGAALVKELQNKGHANWKPIEHPELLLLEIEGSILIREVQVNIATHMQKPTHDKNAVMQLNMGEGKSSVIVPMLVRSLADSDKLMRVIVAKPQRKQMVHMLVSKLGGLVDRQVFHLPFSRSIKIGPSEVSAIQKLLKRCRDEGGVLLVQPEHILSFQLMGIEHKISQKNGTADQLLHLHDFMRRHSCDFVDESDDNFSPKFELVYSLGLQQPIDHSPERWTCIQEVLDAVRKCLPTVKQQFLHGTDIQPGSLGCFPHTRLIEPKAADKLLDMVADYVCHRKPSSQGFLGETTKNTLLLLRGLLAKGILAFAFGHKRWRVDNGLDTTRSPPTRLAVPFRAKDHPSIRSEFSHPDVVILLTTLSYYYEGLTNGQLDSALSHLDRSDQRADEYATLVKDADSLPSPLEQLSGVNLDDPDFCSNKLFPCFRYSKAAVDYFLAHVVFITEMKEFPHRLSASGWDIGEQKPHPTTGFSGTSDAQIVLPLSVTQTALPAQAHTNALVLQHLLQAENSVMMIPPPQHATVGNIQFTHGPLPVTTDAEQFLEMVVAMNPPVRVILDVGAQIIELDNLGVAQMWLALLSDDSRTEAAVFVDKQDNIFVVDRKGHVEALQTSPYCTQLSLCVVFLDDAHTRGTHLKLPEYYRAAVTLGANLVKDRLVPVCVSDVLVWSISETWHDARRNTALWADQGRRHESHSQLWAQARGDETLATVKNGNQTMHLAFTEDLAKGFLEDEAQLLETRETQRLILQRCQDLGATGSSSPTILQEEQERELAPEVEEQRQLERPGKAEPQEHSINADVVEFVQTGSIRAASKAFIPVYEWLADSSAGRYLSQLRRRRRITDRVHCTRDFQATIKTPGVGHVSDLYQRPVQWILTGIGALRSFEAASPSLPSPRPPSAEQRDKSVGKTRPKPEIKRTLKHMVIISPYEAQGLMDMIKQSHAVTLHLYAPLLNERFGSLDSLDLYTVPSLAPQPLLIDIPVEALRKYLHAPPPLSPSPSRSPSEGESSEGRDRAAMARMMDENLVGLLNVIMMKIRRNCETIDKTHTGKALDSRLIAKDDFKE